MAREGTIGTAVLWITAKTDGLRKGLREGQSLASKAVGQMGRGFDQMGRAAGIAGAAISGVLGKGLYDAIQFEKGMREVNTMLGLSQTEFKSLSGDVLDLSKRMGVDAIESTHALYQVVSKGVPQDNLLTFMETASKAAIGGVTDTKTAVDGLTTVLNAFHMQASEAGRVSDVMFETIKRGGTTFGELAAYMFNVAPIAASANVRFEEVSAAIATITKQGTPTAQATTQIRAALTAMLSPTDAAKARFKELGIQYDENVVKTRGFAAAAEMFVKASGGSSDMLRKMLGSVEAINAVLGVTGQNAQVFAEDLRGMESSAGAAQAAFEEMNESTARQLEQAQSNLQALSVTVGTQLAPVLTDVLTALQPVIEAIGSWVEQNRNAIPTLAKVGVGLLGVKVAMSGVISPMLGMSKGLYNVIGGATRALAMMRPLNSALGLSKVGLAGSLGLIVGAGGIGYAFGAWLYKAAGQVDGLQEKLDLLGRTAYKAFEVFGGGVESVEVGPKWKPPTGALQRMASGGIAAGGLTLVGEEGPELVELQRGAQVHDAPETAAMMGPTINVEMPGMVIREEADIDKIARGLGRLVDSRMVARGMRPVTR